MKGWFQKRSARSGPSGDACGQAIEQVALRCLQTAMFDPCLFQLMLVDGIARDARLAQRHVDNAHGAPLAVDRCRDHAFDWLTARQCVGGGCLRRQAAYRLDQFDAAADHFARIGTIDRADIGAVDQAQAQVRGAVPHREGCSLDQSRQRFQRIAQLVDLAFERLDFGLAVGRVEYPQHDATV